MGYQYIAYFLMCVFLPVAMFCLLPFMPLPLQVTEVAYIESDGLIEALSNLPGGPSNLSLTQQVLHLVASAERGSEHPLAQVRSSPLYASRLKPQTAVRDVDLGFMFFADERFWFCALMFHTNQINTPPLLRQEPKTTEAGEAQL